MSMRVSTRLWRTVLALAGAALPTSAMAEACSELEAKRNETIAVVTTKAFSLRGSLISFLNEREEVHNQNDYEYDFTATSSGWPYGKS